ncbi:MAG TPA: alginate export family protein [Planctomycetota bacterium]|nr:alginate export family protein [Planctomycetota bacterium]
MPDLAAQDLGQLVVGHWVRLKGALDERGEFVVSEIELREPGSAEELFGTARDVDVSEGNFAVLGQRVHVSERTEWTGVTLDTLEGVRVLVQGHYRGLLKFSGREIEARDKGRDRIEGRIDQLVHGPDGSLELRVMSFRVRVPADAKLSAEKPVAEYPLAPEGAEAQVFAVRDEDEVRPGSISLTDTLSFGGQLEWKTERRDNYDLDDQARNDEVRQRWSLRGEFLWEPSPDFFALLGLRGEATVNRQEEDPTNRDQDGDLTEAYGYWRDPFGFGLDMQVGRQDFDEPREWLYDRNLDAVRANWNWTGGRLELSASTVLTEGSATDRDTNNLIAYLSNGDWNRHVGAYVIDRQDHSGDEDKPIFAGVRALGEWIPDNEVWLELSAVRGYNDTVDFGGEALDVGTTWSPPPLDPFYFTVGYALGSGDSDPNDDVDEAFQQTGLQDNNGRFGGVTSFRYYGELVDPELSNLGIVTVGVGTRLSRKTSLDLVWHSYRQADANDSLVNSDLDADPDGVHQDLGTELDLILGLRSWDHVDVEVVLADFDPGAAFPDGDNAWLGAFQVRYRF